MAVLLNLSSWIERRRDHVGPYAEHIVHSVKAYEREIERLRACLDATRDEICEGPVDDVLWHDEITTTVDNITLTLEDGWTYDGWLGAKGTQA